MKKVLITGGAGYLGSVLIGELLIRDYEVTVIDNFMYEQVSLNNFCAHNNFNIINGDIRDEGLMKSQLANTDIIIPLAAFVGAPLCSKDPFGASSINHDAILTMLTNISKDQLVIMPTTNSAYGSGNENNFCTEESPLKPISLYAKEKVKVEKELMNHDNAISLRLATVFGMSPRMRIDLLVNDFVHRAVNDGFVVLFESHFKRNYVHVRDVASAFIHSITHQNSMKGNIYNVGLSEANISKFELCERIRKQLPNFVFVDEKIGKDPDQRNYIISNAKIEKTGFRTQVGLDQGIEELIKGFSMIKNRKYGNV
jgi:nucleoside-diphosphate-sugar epimerase